MNPFKVAWRSLGMAWANYLVFRLVVMFVLVAAAILVVTAFRSCHESSNTKITLSTMVKVGDGGWQKAECTVWVEGRSDDLDAKMWGVWVGDWYVTDNVREVESGSER